MKHFLKKSGKSFSIDQLVNIFDFLDDMVVLIEVGKDGVFRFGQVNQAFLNVMGITSDSLKNKQICEVLKNQEEDIIIEKFKEAIFKKQTLSFELNTRLFNELKIFEMTVIPISLEESHFCRNLVCVVRDISEKKRYENTVLEAKEQLNKLVEYQQGIIIEVEKRGEDFYYLFCEGPLLQQFNLTAEEVIGKRPQDIFPSSIIEGILKQYKYCWDLKDNYFYEWADSTDDFEFCWLAILSPIIENGEMTSFIIYAVDILERKKTEKQLIKSEKLALIGELAAGIGHEIRNPLTAIKGFIKLMKQNKVDIREEFLDIIDNELESINRIASELMILAKPQAFEFKSIDVNEILNEVIFLVEPEAFMKGVEMNRNYQTKKTVIFGDRQQIKQVMINLIKNAIEALESQSNGKISIETKMDESIVYIRISDNGCGIPKETLKKIWEPFYTTKEKGNGLGLMVTHRIIKNHEGTIHCESEEGKGTSFVMSFPKCKYENQSKGGRIY